MGLEGFASQNGILYLEEGSQTAYACEVEKVTKMDVEAFTPKNHGHLQSSLVLCLAIHHEIPMFLG